MTRTRGRGAGDGSIDNAGEGDGNETAASVHGRRRRSHRKSRNGCAECKRRHIRCDERRPVCAHCAIAQRACLFPPPPPEKPPPRRRPREDAEEEEPARHRARGTGDEANRANDDDDDDASARQSRSTESTEPHAPSLSKGTPSASSSSLPPRSLPSFDEAFPPPTTEPVDAAVLFTPQHLVLLHHATTSDDDTVFPRGQTAQVVDIAVRRAADAPYLIDQVLALSALHLATTAEQQAQSSSARPSPSSSSSPPSSSSSPSSLRHQATELQTRAVACFTRHARSIPADDAASAIPRFLFASTLSLHVMAETLAEVRHLHHSRFHVFIDRFAECLRLHHGIRAVITPTWQDLLKSELEPLLSVTHDAHERVKARRAGTSADALPTDGTGTPTGPADSRGPDGCAHLLALLETSDLGPSTVNACREAVQRLQWAFEIAAHLDDPYGGPHAASAFSVTVGSEYIDVLRRQQPEALVILAHYGVLLHRSRRFWIFGDAGAFVIRAIAQHLGSYWRDALAWPLQVLQDEPG